MIRAELGIWDPMWRARRRAIAGLKHVVVVTDVGTELPHLLDLPEGLGSGPKVNVYLQPRGSSADEMIEISVSLI
jgi:hypothetical protein